MENATQAILIAGGVLLGILTITLLVYMLSTISTMGNAQQQTEEVQRLAEWNSEWEAYNKKLLYGTEVLTVINKANQNNKEYDDYNGLYSVTVKGKNLNNSEFNFDDFVEFVKAHKTSVFTCEGIQYNEKGRVSEMVFKFVE